MKKLIILKSLIDFIWIVTCIPLIGVLIFLLVYMFIELDTIDILFFENISFKESPNGVKQLFGAIYILLAFGVIYCFFLFRKTLRYFQKVKPFHDTVINNFHIIGFSLTIIGIIGIILLFCSRIYFKNEFKTSFGVTPQLTLACLGLFFMVLSEIFKIAKLAKEENDLTI